METSYMAPQREVTLAPQREVTPASGSLEGGDPGLWLPRGRRPRPLSTSLLLFFYVQCLFTYLDFWL